MPHTCRSSTAPIRVLPMLAANLVGYVRCYHRSGGSDLLQQGYSVQVDTTFRDLSFDGIVLVHRATGHNHRCTRSGSPGKRSGVFGFETPLDDHHVVPKDHVFGDMAIPWEPGNEGSNELTFDGVLTVHSRTSYHEQNVISVITHDATDVRSFPSGEIFRKECPNLTRR